MSAPGRLHPDDLAALADLVADRLAARLPDLLAARETGPGSREPVARRQAARNAPGRLLTAREAAALLHVSAEWVREHGRDLATPLGDGPRPRLRWTPEAVEELTRRFRGVRSSGAAEPVPPREAAAARPRPRGIGPGSLPVREVQPRPFPKKSGGHRANGPAPATTQGGTAP